MKTRRENKSWKYKKVINWRISAVKMNALFKVILSGGEKIWKYSASPQIPDWNTDARGKTTPSQQVKYQGYRKSSQSDYLPTDRLLLYLWHVLCLSNSCRPFVNTYMYWQFLFFLGFSKTYACRLQSFYATTWHRNRKLFAYVS